MTVIGIFTRPAPVTTDCVYYSLTYTHTILVGGGGKILFELVHIAKLPTIPGYIIATISKRIAYLIIGYGFAIVAYKQILPFTIIRIGIGMLCAARQNTRGISIFTLR